MNKCGHCKRKIENEAALIARGQLWHTGHFFCSLCGCRIQENEKFEEKESASMCSHCFCQLDAVHCAGCLAPIEEHFVEAAGGRFWHPTCFSCSVCLQPLNDKYVENNGGLPMHSKCYWEYQLVISNAASRKQ